MDGTFKSVPDIYLQLFTIQVFEGDKLIPLIYCLLSTKTRAMYSDVFRYLKDKASNLNVVLSPNLLTCDFESGLIASVRIEFSATQIRGCYFHFCQAVYRHVQTLGLSQLYINDENSRLSIRKLLALAFLPIFQIPLSFENLKSQCSQELQPLFEYFESYWINKIEHALWNMHKVQRRTNNNLEGWHLRLNRKVGKAHANIYEFLSNLIQEQGATETLLSQIAAGNIQSLSKNDKYKQVNEKIERLTANYNSEEINIDEFLKGIALNISQPTNLSL